jgi:putative sugar O-methyltransferase
MHDYPNLNLAIEDMSKQDNLYRPTSFWSEASIRIFQQICSHGIECFRSLPEILGFFTPTYGSPGNSFTVEQSSELMKWFHDEFPHTRKPQLALEQFLNGEMLALSDYRVLLASDDEENLPYLHTFSESAVGKPIEHFEFEGRSFSRSSLNYLLGLAMLKKHLHGDIPMTVMEIGGGFGVLGEVLSYSGIDSLRYIDVDIPPTSFVAEYYLSEVLGRGNVATYKDTHDIGTIEINNLPAVSVFCPWQLENLRGKIDLFVNFISFQEMEPNIVNNYLEHVVRLDARWILLRNIREGKQIRRGQDSVGVDIPIRTDDYLEMISGYELVQRNVFPYGYKTVDGYHSELLLLRKKCD